MLCDYLIRKTCICRRFSLERESSSIHYSSDLKGFPCELVPLKGIASTSFALFGQYEYTQDNVRLRSTLSDTATRRGRGRDASFLLLVLFAFLLLWNHAPKVAAQSVSVKTNLLYLATTTPNLGVDFRVADHWSMSLHGSYNPFLFPQWQDKYENVYNPKLIHWAVMPEVKYWFCETYERSFIGIHGIYGHFNVGGIPFVDSLKSVRYYGQAYGAGLSYGYQLPIGEQWGLELSLGLGFLRLQYNKCDAFVCGDTFGRFQRDYIGPTKAAVTLVYFIK